MIHIQALIEPPLTRECAQLWTQMNGVRSFEYVCIVKDCILMHIIEIIEAIGQASVDQINDFFHVYLLMVLCNCVEKMKKGQPIDSQRQQSSNKLMLWNAKQIKSNANGAWMWFDEKGINAKHNVQCTDNNCC